MNGRNYGYLFVVDAAHHGVRIDTFLSSRLRNHVPARIQRMAAVGLITVNDEPCSAVRRVFRSEEVVVRLAEPPEPFYPPEQAVVDVLYDDPWLTAVNKPAGLIVHPSGPVGHGTLANVLQGHLDASTRLPGLLRPGIVHRLDRETSGVVVTARCATAHADLTRQFERGAVEKAYLALVSGRVAPSESIIDRPIGRRPDSLLMSTAIDAIDARPATTAYRVLRHFRSATLLDVRPRTGRKHQIRVHLAAVGHPILGDAAYGNDDRNDAGRPFASGRHALHAAAIVFRHPITQSLIRILASPPPDFWATLAK